MHMTEKRLKQNQQTLDLVFRTAFTKIIEKMKEVEWSKSRSNHRPAILVMLFVVLGSLACLADGHVEGCTAKETGGSVRMKDTVGNQGAA